MAADLFITYCKQHLKVEVVPELQFHPTRKWRFDYAIPSHKIAIEVEGGVWNNGRHTRGKGFLNDMEKYNSATLMGWRLFRVTPKTLISTPTFTLISDALKS